MCMGIDHAEILPKNSSTAKRFIINLTNSIQPNMIAYAILNFMPKEAQNQEFALKNNSFGWAFFYSFFKR